MDILETINNLKLALNLKYGDLLDTPFDQCEKHLTYYIGDLLKKHGHTYEKVPGKEGIFYSEQAMQQAFIAGTRLNQICIEQQKLQMKKEILNHLQNIVNEISDDF